MQQAQGVSDDVKVKAAHAQEIGHAQDAKDVLSKLRNNEVVQSVDLVTAPVAGKGSKQLSALSAL